MFERVKFIGPTILASSLFFAYLFYIGSRMQSGETLKGRSGIMRMLADGFNTLSDVFGASIAGYGVMACSLFFGVFTAVWLWRTWS